MEAGVALSLVALFLVMGYAFNCMFVAYYIEIVNPPRWHKVVLVITRWVPFCATFLVGISTMVLVTALAFKRKA